MMLQALGHLLLTTALLRMLPVDALDLEVRAVSDDSVVPLSVHNAFALSQAHLPVAKNIERAPVKRREHSIGVVTSAVSAFVLDRTSGEILFQKNIEEPRSIGSITKLMTAHVVLESGVNLNESVTLLAEDVRFGGVQHLSMSDTYTLQDLLYASLISSDNTATAALARLTHLSQGDFIARMNEEAAELGMKHTRFVDATGLSSKNQSVVDDLAVLIHEAAKHDLIRAITQHAQYTILGTSGTPYLLENTNELLTQFVNEPPYKIEAAKTGFLPEAGYCISALFSFDGAHEIIVVVLGAESDMQRFQDVKALTAWAYDVFEWQL